MRSCSMTAHAAARETWSSEAWELRSRDSWNYMGKVSGKCQGTDELLGEVLAAKKGMIRN